MQTQHVAHEFKPDFGFSKSGSKLVRRVWTRWEHGQIPVSVWETETRSLVYELEREQGSEFYRSARRLLKAVTGKDRHQTFGTYFKLDQAKDLACKPSILTVLDKQRRKVRVPAVKGELRETKPVVDAVEVETQSPGFDLQPTDDGLKLTAGANGTRVRELVSAFGGLEAVLDSVVEELDASEDITLGIDLENRSHEVRKLLFKSFRGHMLARHYDPDDVLQEIYKGLVTRNSGMCPWDGRKSTFGYYVTLVSRCVLTNYHRKAQRRLDREHIELDEGMLAPAGTWSESSDELAMGALHDWLADPEHGGDTPDGLMAVEVLPFVTQGMQRREIVDATGHKENLVSRGLAHLRKWSRAWAAELDIQVRERRRRKTTIPAKVN